MELQVITLLLTLIQRRYIICEVYMPVYLNVKGIEEGRD